jgi:hypothetical protein
MDSKIKFLVIAVVILAGSIGSASCETSNDQDANTTLALSGSTVHTIFSVHGFGQNEEVMEALAKGHGKAEVAKNLRQVIKDQHQLISSLEDQQLFIKKKLVHNDIKWWGIEASPMEMKHGLSIEAQAQDLRDMKSLLKGVGLSNIETSQILTLMYPPSAVLMAQFPEIVSKVKFIPLDNDKAKEESFKLVKNMSQQRHELFHLGADKKLLTFTQFTDIDDLSSDSKEKEQMLTVPEIQSATSGIKDAKARETAEALLKNTNTFLQMSSQRDDSAAKVISQQQGEGIVTMGSHHKSGVIEKTLAQCKSSSSVTPKGYQSQDGNK